MQQIRSKLRKWTKMVFCNHKAEKFFFVNEKSAICECGLIVKIEDLNEYGKRQFNHYYKESKLNAEMDD